MDLDLQILSIKKMQVVNLQYLIKKHKRLFKNLLRRLC